jgi:large-conductance mechanosensitive channel
VISPFGNGMDCHRTWEALVLGCITIVSSSGMNELFKDLPALIVNNWSDVTQDLLDNTIEEFNKKTFNYEKLQLNYWKNKINSYKQNESFVSGALFQYSRLFEFIFYFILMPIILFIFIFRFISMRISKNREKNYNPVKWFF